MKLQNQSLTSHKFIMIMYFRVHLFIVYKLHDGKDEAFFVMTVVQGFSTAPGTQYLFNKYFSINERTESFYTQKVLFYSCPNHMNLTQSFFLLSGKLVSRFHHVPLNISQCKLWRDTCSISPILPYLECYGTELLLLIMVFIVLWGKNLS